jgi:hypothetical protein
MRSLSRTLLTATSLLATAALAGCVGDDDDDPTGPPPVAGSATISGDITANRTLRADTTYTLSGFIKVQPGATLTIQAGTRIVGDFDVPGSSLFVLPGAQIRAIGTAQNPIVFTSSRPVGQRQAGDWGGLVIIGRGQVNRTSPTILEGTGNGANNPAVNYAGGTDNADNSGVLQYVRVEFAGYATAQDAELNSFTFAAVGSGTTLDHLESLYGLDDSFEWFGGAVDAKYLVSYESGDDHFDMSEGYTGRNQFLIGYQSVRVTPRPAAGSPSSDPQGIENDGCAGQNCNAGQNSTPLTAPLVANFTLVGTGAGVVDATSGGIGVMLRRGTAGSYVNGIVARWPRAAVSLRDASTIARATAGELALRNVYVAESGPTFEPQGTGAGASVQGSLDLAANAIDVAAAGTTAASLFTALPATPTDAAALDWSPSAAAAVRTGGLTPFTGALATKAAASVSATAYRGAAAPSGEKWWQGWTAYARN